jgi:hypothetical protein
MAITTGKPRLVYFQWKHDSLPMFLRMHFLLHVRCLSESFDVIVINEDCDYGKICDIHQPQLALFESGYKTSISVRIKITNTSSHPEVPKLGLHNGDPWCDCRVGFISDMAQWGIKTFFTICTTTAEHTPEIADNLFVWANFIDSDVYHDYGQEKIVPVLFNGNTSSVYPWRKGIQKLISKCYPSLSFPHLGYESYSPIMIHGEQYARTINGSFFVPACGTVANEVIRKHFEIPGSRSCLITEESTVLKAAGFIDMQNCVFADENNVLDKISHLFNNREQLEAITQSGFELVQSRHTLKQRDQIFQWYTLNQNLKYNETIIQVSPFEPLCVVQKSTGTKSNHVSGNGIHLQLLKEGDICLWTGKFDEAESLYIKCLNLIHWMSEPKLKMAICDLYRGRPQSALSWISTPIQNNLSIYQASDPDPVEWAYFIRCLLCQGDLFASIMRASQFTWVFHPELDRIRLVVNCLQHKKPLLPLSYVPGTTPKFTIHHIPQLEFNLWLEELRKMLVSCQQFEYSDLLQKLSIDDLNSQLNKKTLPKKGIKSWLMMKRKFILNRMESVFKMLHLPNRKTGLPSASEIDYLIRLSKFARIDVLKKKFLKYGRIVKEFAFSIRRYKSAHEPVDEYFQELRSIFQEEHIESILIISEAIESLETKKLLLNLKGGSVNIPFTGQLIFDLIYLDDDKVDETNLPLKSFDLILFDTSNVKLNIQQFKIPDGKFLLLKGTGRPQGYMIKNQISLDVNYTNISHNISSGTDYVIFKRIIPTPALKMNVLAQWNS